METDRPMIHRRANLKRTATPDLLGTYIQELCARISRRLVYVSLSKERYSCVHCIALHPSDRSVALAPCDEIVAIVVDGTEKPAGRKDLAHYVLVHRILHHLLSLSRDISRSRERERERDDDDDDLRSDERQGRTNHA